MFVVSMNLTLSLFLTLLNVVFYAFLILKYSPLQINHDVTVFRRQGFQVGVRFC